MHTTQRPPTGATSHIDELRRRANHDDYTVRCLPATDPNTPIDTLETLTRDPDPRVRRAAASNSAATADMLRHLADDLDEIVRVNVAWNPNTPSDALELLAVDTSAQVRNIVSSREDLDDSVLTAYRYADREIAYSIPTRTATPAVMHALAGHPDAETRFAVLVHHHIETRTVEKLWDNRNTPGLEPFNDDRCESFADHRNLPDRIAEAIPVRVALERNLSLLERCGPPDIVDTFAEEFTGTIGELRDLIAVLETQPV